MKGKTGKTARKLMPEPHGEMVINRPLKHGGSVSGKKPRARADKRARGGGIHIKPSHKGLLHEDLGVPEGKKSRRSGGKKIPAKKLKKAENSKDPAVRKRAVFAENAKKWHHG